MKRAIPIYTVLCGAALVAFGFFAPFGGFRSLVLSAEEPTLIAPDTYSGTVVHLDLVHLFVSVGGFVLLVIGSIGIFRAVRSR